MHLPDVNVWLALTFDSHVHHPAAKSWFEGLTGDAVCNFCRLTQQGFLRLATNPRVFGPDAVALAEAWRLYDLFRGDERVSFAEEPAGTESHWRRFTQSHTFSPKVWNDAYLAAFVLAAGWELVTFDLGLKQYPGVNVRCLT